MLKNKIYIYLSAEIFKNFITILLTFTAIAWTVRAVNFLDLMIEDGYPANIYLQYSLLNISTIVTRFVPLSFLLSLIISIAKFERQQELMILWTSGLNKIKITNFFLLIGLIIALFQITLGLVVNPFSLNKSRSLLRETDVMQINSVIKSNDFSDTFKGVTFYISEKNSKNELINIFIRDNTGSLNTIVSEVGNSNNTTIFAKKGFVENNKLILFDGIIQTLNKKKEIENMSYEKTELSIANFANRTITQPKIQETSSVGLINCMFKNKNAEELSLNCSSNNKQNVIETLSRRAGMPLYIPLIAVVCSFMLNYRKEKKYNFLKKYTVFISAFIILILAEILLKFSGFSLINFSLYFFSPLILLLILYTLLKKNMMSEKIK
ncbi:LptF/LptG family permease [Pelagibacteraceae bacterium]|nr:LptF/LptG family permease [Pelagibacteraceae bacterium]|tara:strand:+ start:901 stop:2040 length:1140 start_codon:yes stop_codon:yes gene_type:complete